MAKTWATLREEIKDDMNLQGEDFVSDAELLAWANDGIEQAEKEIVSLYDKYFETDADLALVTGQSLYDLPSDILAHKITHVEYDDGTTEFEIKYLRRKEDFRYQDDNDKVYRYRLRNDSANGMQIKLYPASLETSSSNVKIYYIRSAARIASDSDVIEIPIADAFVKQYIKEQVRAKELGPMFNYQESPAFMKQRELMIEALNNMIPDETRDEIEIRNDDMVEYYDDTDFYN